MSLVTQKEHETQEEHRNSLLEQELSNVLKAPGLMPSSREVAALKAKRLGQAQLSYRAWLETCRDQADPHRPTPPLFNGLGKSAEKKWADQRERAKAVAKLMVEAQLKKIVLMDGHGRFVFALLDALLSLEQDLAEYAISLVDMDLDVHDWHVEFIPGTHAYVDILDLEPSSDTFYYLNFCSLGDQKRRTLNFIAHAPKPLMVSFFRRNPIGAIGLQNGRLVPPDGHCKNKDGSLSFVGMITELNQLNYAVVSSRGLFVTLVIKI